MLTRTFKINITPTLPLFSFLFSDKLMPLIFLILFPKVFTLKPDSLFLNKSNHISPTHPSPRATWKIFTVTVEACELVPDNPWTLSHANLPSCSLLYGHPSFLSLPAISQAVFYLTMVASTIWSSKNNWISLFI